MGLSLKGLLSEIDEEGRLRPRLDDDDMALTDWLTRMTAIGNEKKKQKTLLLYL